jgi:hypothetical protein
MRRRVRRCGRRRTTVASPAPALSFITSAALSTGLNEVKDLPKGETHPQGHHVDEFPQFLKYPSRSTLSVGQEQGPDERRLLCRGAGERGSKGTRGQLTPSSPQRRGASRTRYGACCRNSCRSIGRRWVDRRGWKRACPELVEGERGIWSAARHHGIRARGIVE